MKILHLHLKKEWYDMINSDGNPKDEVKYMMTAVEDLRNTLDAKVVRLEEELEYTRAHLSKLPQYTQRIEFL